MIQKSETWHLLIFSRDRKEILVKSPGLEFQLPRITIPAGQRIAAGIVSGVAKQLGLRVVALYEVFPRAHTDGCGDYYHAAVSHSAQNAPCGMRWLPVHSISASHFQGEDALAFEALWSKLQKTTNHCPSEPFAGLDWFAEVSDWISSLLQTHSMFLTGAFRQFNASSTFSLIQFETNRRPVWFKAVGQPNIREYAVTLALANLCPRYLPKIIASNPSWHAWLSEEAAGTSLAMTTCANPWQSAAESLANLQFLAHSQENLLCKSGVRNLRASQLLARVPQFFAYMTACRLEAGHSAEEELHKMDLSALHDALSGALTELDGLGIPDTIGHMDLNPQNIFCSGSGTIFLDWAESFVGCPFFSFEYLLQHFRRTHFADCLTEAQLREAYLGRWRNLLSTEVIQDALPLMPLTALFSHAVTLCSDIFPRHLPSPAQRRYLFQLLRRMNRMPRTAKEVCG
jgi:hypothetical protein